MGATIVAVIGTLAGALGATALQYVTTIREQRRQALVTAATELLRAVVRHREHQWLKIAAMRDGLRDADGTREKRYAARSAVTTAMDALYMATQDPALIAAAQEAVDAAMALGDFQFASADVPEDELAEARLRTQKAHTALRVSAAKAVS